MSYYYDDDYAEVPAIICCVVIAAFLVLGFLVLGGAAADKYAESLEPLEVVAVENIVSEEEQVSLLSKIEGLELPIPLSEKEIQLHALKDEVIALIKAADEKDVAFKARKLVYNTQMKEEKDAFVKSMEVKQKALGDRKARYRADVAELKQRASVPAMAKGWKLLSETTPPKDAHILVYSSEFKGDPYWIMRYKRVANDKAVWSIRTGGGYVKELTSTLKTANKTYWMHLEDFDQEKDKVEKVGKLTSNNLKKGLTIEAIAKMFGSPDKRSMQNGHKGVVVREWNYYSKDIEGKLRINFLKFEDDKLTYWNLGYNF